MIYLTARSQKADYWQSNAVRDCSRLTPDKDTSHLEQLIRFGQQEEAFGK